jgi:hypothetical protein
MNKIIDQAHIVHRTANRLRIRIPGRRLDEAFFRELKTKLAGCPGVVAVVANPLTGSVLIEHGPEFCPAVFCAVGLAIWLDEHGADRLNHIDLRALLHHAMAKRDKGQDAHLAVAKLAFAAATGRLWSHILELIVEWCAVALIEAVLQPVKASAQVILLPQRRRNQHQAVAAAA